MPEFIYILWYPSHKYWDNIEKRLNNSEDMKIVKSREYKFSSEKDFETVLTRIYKTDTIGSENWMHIQKKINMLVRKNSVSWQFRVLYVKVKNPKYKWYSFTVQTMHLIKLKRQIRNKFRDFIPNYKYDIIIHSTDNVRQTYLLTNVLRKL